MSLSIEEIKKNYSNLPDYKIQKIAEESSSTLPPEVIKILEEEIIKRKLNQNLLKSVAVQRDPISEEVMNSLKEKIESCICPSCGVKNQKLIAVNISEASSIVLFTIYKERVFVACRNCTKKEQNTSIIKTLLLGWWSPWGFFYYTPKAIFKSIINKQNQEKNSPFLLKSFVQEYIGSIQTVIDEPSKITKLIAKHNSTK